MWKKLSDWWTKAWLEGEDIEYYRYLQRYPVRADFIRGKTKAELAQELHDWKVRSTEQGITMQAEATKLKEENSSQTKAVFKLQAEICRLTIVNLEQFFRLELQKRANMATQNQPTKEPRKDDEKYPR